jgi:uncharacterized protein YndB with AHSA1/START domain
MTDPGPARHAVDPIVLAVELDAGPTACFERFTRDFGRWWPVLTHSMSRDAATRCLLECHPGGRVLETAPDGTEHLWGTVTAFVPGERVRFSWHPGRGAESAQWIEVRFEPTGRGSRVTLTHGGWEALGEIGPTLHREYLPGWRRVFVERFAAWAGGRH